MHFTQFGNLRGIVEHGLLSRKTLAERGYTFYPSGPYRLDDCEEAVSVSISCFNEPVFAAKRYKTGRPHWVVLVLSSNISWNLYCRFSWCNVAKRAIRNRIGRRDGSWAFEEMFAGSDEDRSGLPLGHPTDIEAEVQVLRPIPRDCIIGAIVERPELVEQVRTILALLPGEKRQVWEVDSFIARQMPQVSRCLRPDGKLAHHSSPHSDSTSQHPWPSLLPLSADLRVVANALIEGVLAVLPAIRKFRGTGANVSVLPTI